MDGDKCQGRKGGWVGMGGGAVVFGTKTKQLTKLALTCLYHVYVWAHFYILIGTKCSPKDRII